MVDENPVLPQMHELQVIVNKLKVVKIELLESFQVGAIITEVSSTCKGYRKKILHNFEDFSLEQVSKHLWIEEESRARDKNENSYASTSTANAVNKPNNSKKNKQNQGKPLGPKKDQGKFKKKKAECIVSRKPGHYACDCRFKETPNEDTQVNSIEEEEIVATVYEIDAAQGNVPG